ncbi:MAG: hypothetical protein K6T99_04305 [Armatimonadetes bacterium]|nr:hypothetical protein [Armatimonadota bacterium]
MRRRITAAKNDDVSSRLAVIEEKIELVISELSAIRAYIPGKMVEHQERITVLERSIRGIQWLGGALAIALIGAFIGHVLGR